MKITYLGHSAFHLHNDDYNLLIDPFLTGNPLALAKPQDFTDVDAIFVTHGHGDHIGDAVEISKRTGALVICGFEVSLYLSSLGANCHGMGIGGTFDFPFGRVKMTPALHGSDISTPNGLIPGGMAGGFLLTIDGLRIYHAGDTGLTMEMQLLKNKKVDVAMLPIGGNYTMDIPDAIRAAEFVFPRIAIPMHYNTFDVIKADPQVFADKMTPEVIAQIMVPGETYAVRQ